MRSFFIFLILLFTTASFLAGIHIGKYIQKIDSPQKIIYKTQKIKLKPSISLMSYKINKCKFQFIVPSTFSVNTSSSSAAITYNKKQLLINCIKNASSSAKYVLSSKINGSRVSLQGSSEILSAIEGGFDKNFKAEK